MALIQIVGPVFDSSDNLVNGTLTLSWPSFNTAGAKTVVAGTREISVVNGVLSIELEDTQTSNPTFAYIAQWSIVNQADSTEYWAIPSTGGPYTPSQVRSLTASGPGIYVSSNYQFVDNNGSALPQRGTLNVQPPLTASDDSGNSRTNITATTTGTAGTYGSATQVPVVTTDVYGRVTGVTPTLISFPSGPPTFLRKTSNYTVLTSDGTNVVILADATLGSFTITLHTAAGSGGSQITVVKIKTDTTSNTVTVASVGGAIDGGSTAVLGTPGQAQSFGSDNTNWWTIWSNSVGKSLRGATFTTSGTFTPSAALIASGGWVTVLYLVGGGSGGGNGTTLDGGGGAGQVIKNHMLQITSAQTITIAGAAAVGTNGSASSIGALLVAAGGTAPTATVGGASGAGFVGASGSGSSVGGGGGGAGGPGKVGNSATAPGLVPYGGDGIDGLGVGGNGNGASAPVAASPANSGKGGDINQAGGTGFCSLQWFE